MPRLAQMGAALRPLELSWLAHPQKPRRLRTCVSWGNSGDSIPRSGGEGSRGRQGRRGAEFPCSASAPQAAQVAHSGRRVPRCRHAGCDAHSRSEHAPWQPPCHGQSVGIVRGAATPERPATVAAGKDDDSAPLGFPSLSLRLLRGPQPPCLPWPFDRQGPNGQSIARPTFRCSTEAAVLGSLQAQVL